MNTPNKINPDSNPTVPKNNIIPMPAAFAFGYRKHDMAVGPCSCGATHRLTDWPQALQDSLATFTAAPLTPVPADDPLPEGFERVPESDLRQHGFEPEKYPTLRFVRPTAPPATEGTPSDSPETDAKFESLAGMDMLDVVAGMTDHSEAMERQRDDARAQLRDQEFRAVAAESERDLLAEKPRVAEGERDELIPLAYESRAAALQDALEVTTDALFSGKDIESARIVGQAALKIYGKE